MSANAAEQLRRLLDLIPRLADGEEHDVADVAARVGVPVKVLLADLESLTDRYAPAGFVEGISVYLTDRTVGLFSNHFRRPMRLTMAELCALELGLAVLRAERAPDEHAAIDGALARLREVITRLPANDRHEGLRHAELSAAADAAHLATIRRAIVRRETVRLAYRRANDDEPADRVIRPYSLAFAQGMWYVVAYCERSEGMRFFRLDRVAAADGAGGRFDVPPAFSVESLLRDGRILAGEPATTMTVRYGPRVARWIAEREGRPLDADGSLTMEHPLHDLGWGVRHVLQYGPDAEVTGPPEVRAEVARRLGAMELAEREP